VRAAALLMLCLIGSTSVARALDQGPPASGLAAAVRGAFAPTRSSALELWQGQQPGCPDCEPRTRKFWRGAWQLMVVQLIPASVNNVLRDAEWAKISPASWAANLENPWQWDNNKFVNNQFSHPYHGSLYFNSARVNGYSFWESAPWAFGGSLMWELFGESWAPSPNDLWNTSLGGITLGETLYRLTTLTLDNRATGFERVMREIGGTLLNPVEGFNRLVDGRMNDINENPADWRPSRIQASLDLGYRHTAGTNSIAGEESLDQGFIQLFLLYGDQVEDLTKKPFSAFTLLADLGSNTGESGRLSQLRARGSLGAHTLSRSDNALHQLAGFITYDFYSLPSVEFGGQGFQGGVVSRWGPPRGTRIYTELLAIGMPVAALQSDYYVTTEGRDYDYGIGLGGRAEARAVFNDRGWLRAQGNYLWQPILSGFNGEHTQASAIVEARYFIGRKLGAGASYTWYHRRSNYDSLDDVTRDGNQARVFASLAIPSILP
jgi:hypothetical protein